LEKDNLIKQAEVTSDQHQASGIAINPPIFQLQVNPTNNTPTQLKKEEEVQELSSEDLSTLSYDTGDADPPGDKNNLNQLSQAKPPVFQLKSSSSSGMPDETLNKMSSSFGTDFSDVNIHSDSKSAVDAGALAYTQGNDIHFAPGQYDPGSQSGQELLGHELTHVQQQREGRVQANNEVNGLPLNDDKGLEEEADIKGAKAAQFKSNNIGISSLKSNDHLLPSSMSGISIQMKFERTDNKNSKDITYTTIQRVPDPPSAAGVVDIPLEVGRQTTRLGLAMGLLIYADQFSALSRNIAEEQNFTGNTSALDRISGELLRTSRQFGTEPDRNLEPMEAAITQGFVTGYQETFDTEFNAFRSHMLRNVQRVASTRPIDEMTPELAEAQRVAFENGDTSRLSQLQTVVDAAKDYNGYISTWGGRVSSVSSAIRNSRRTQTLISASESFGDYAERASQKVTAMRAFDTAVTGGRGSATQQSLNRFQAGLDVIDIGMSFVKAVPLIGDLWSNYYYPAATACITALGRIATARDRSQRLLTWINSDWNSPHPPAMPSGVGISFMGGASIFRFMWHVFFNSYTFDQSVEDFFMDHADSFNAVCHPRITITGDWNPFEDNHIANFENFVTSNRQAIWLSLYGADLPFPGSTNTPGTVSPMAE